MRQFYSTVQEFTQDQFNIIVDWTYEDFLIRDCFEETEEQYQEMERRLEKGLDTHYIMRVRAVYNGVEMGCSTLGSCYAYDCSPEDDITTNLTDYLEDLVTEAVAEARTNATAMLDKMKLDFDNAYENHVVSYHCGNPFPDL